MGFERGHPHLQSLLVIVGQILSSEFPFSHLQDDNDNDFSSQGHENSDDACESELGLE